MMKSESNSVTVQIKLYFIAALMAVMGIAFVSPFFDHAPNSADAHQVLVSEAQESTGDSDPIVPDAALGNLISDLMLVFASSFLVTFHYRKEVFPHLTFLYHIRPRSPPTH